jgi:hypothetical protein
MENYLKLTIEYDRVDSGKIHGLCMNPSIIMGLDELNSFKLSKIDYLPRINDKLFFLPGVNIPRVKLKELTLDYNIKIVKDIEDATHIFGGNNFKGKISKTDWFYSVPTEIFKECYEAIKVDLDKYYTEKVDTALEHYTGESVYFDWHGVELLAREELSYYKDFIVNPGSAVKNERSSQYLSIILPDYIEVSKSLTDKVIIHEAGLVDKLNGEDAILINDEVFKQLTMMLSSIDTDNHVIAMEIMANSRYKDSLLYLQMLFKEHSNVMEASNTKNHVNFKSLLSYLGKSGERYLNSSLDNIVASLLDKDVLTKEFLDILIENYGEEVTNRGGTFYFEVKTITVSNEILEKLNINYANERVADFVPKEVIVEDIVIEDKPEELTWL